jgi:glycerol-3-phosphate dehydrogenase
MLIAVPRGAIREGLWREAGALWNLWRQGRRQNIPFRLVFTPSGVRDLAPIQALGGIFIPSVCVVDIEQAVESLQTDASRAGAQFFYGNEVERIESDGGAYVIRTSGRSIEARVLINSAGLQAHEISAMAGGPKYKVALLRGDYYELIGGTARWKIHTLVYPTMPPGAPSKGVHLGPRTDGRLFIGPSATSELQPMPKELFLRAGRRFLPDLSEADLRWAYAGVRPKHIGPDGESDFVIRLDRTDPPLINIIGIDSPGLSASMAIARYVARRLLGEAQP